MLPRAGFRVARRMNEASAASSPESAAVVAHELRNSMAAIVMGREMLEARMPPGSYGRGDIIPTGVTFPIEFPLLLAPV